MDFVLVQRERKTAAKKKCKHCGSELKNWNRAGYCTSGDRNKQTACQVIEKKKRQVEKPNKVQHAVKECVYCGNTIKVRGNCVRNYCSSGVVGLRSACEMLHRNKIIKERAERNGKPLRSFEVDEIATNEYISRFQLPKKKVRCLGYLHIHKEFYFVGDTNNRICPSCKQDRIVRVKGD